MMKKHLIKTTTCVMGFLISGHMFAGGYSLPDPKATTLAPLTTSKKLDSIYLKLPNRVDIYGGYLIDANGINYPAMQYMAGTTQTWLFPTDLKSIFNYKNNVLVSDYDGRTYQLEQPHWVLTAIKLKPRSRVLRAIDDIIACTEPSPAKANLEQPECYALNAGWKLPYSPRLKPEICGTKLRLANLSGKKLIINEIAPDTGSTTKSTRVKKAPGSICDAPMNP